MEPKQFSFKTLYHWFKHGKRDGEKSSKHVYKNYAAGSIEFEPGCEVLSARYPRVFCGWPPGITYQATEENG